MTSTSSIARSGARQILLHMFGMKQVRSSNAPYYQRRASGINYPDLGDFGDPIQITSGVTRHFVVTGGQQR